MSLKKLETVEPHKLPNSQRRFLLLQAGDSDVQSRVEKLLKLSEEKPNGKGMWPGCKRVNTTFPYTTASVIKALRETQEQTPQKFWPVSLQRNARNKPTKTKLCTWLRPEAVLADQKSIDADLLDETNENQVDTMFRRLLFATVFRNNLFSQPLDEKETKNLQKLIVKRNADGSESRAEKVFRLFAGLLSKDLGGALSDDGDDNSDEPVEQKYRTLDENLSLLLKALSGDQQAVLANIVDQIEFQRSQIDFFQSAARNAAVEVEDCEKKLNMCRNADKIVAMQKPERSTLLQVPSTATNTKRAVLQTNIELDDKPTVPPEDQSLLQAPKLPTPL